MYVMYKKIIFDIPIDSINIECNLKKHYVYHSLFSSFDEMFEDSFFFLSF